jgi:hypothetical protein
MGQVAQMTVDRRSSVPSPVANGRGDGGCFVLGTRKRGGRAHHAGGGTEESPKVAGSR